MEIGAEMTKEELLAAFLLLGFIGPGWICFQWTTDWMYTSKETGWISRCVFLVIFGTITTAILFGGTTPGMAVLAGTLGPLFGGLFGFVFGAIFGRYITDPNPHPQNPGTYP